MRGSDRPPRDRSVQHRLELLDADAARTEQHRIRAHELDDRRLEPDRALTPVEHLIDITAEIGAHRVGGRRAHVAEAIRRRRREPATELRKQLERQRSRGHSQAHGVATTRDLVDHASGSA